MFFAVPAATINREVLTAPSATIDHDRCWHYGGMHAGALFFAQNTNMRFITPCITYNEIQMLRAQQQQPEFVVQGPPHHYRALRSLVNPFGHPPLSNIGHGSGLALYIRASGFWVLELIGVFRTNFWRSGSSSAFPGWVFCVVERAAAFSGCILCFLKCLLTKKI